MRYHNGVLHPEQDSTLRMRPLSEKRELTWDEYVPFVILGFLIMGLIMTGLLFI